MTIQLTENEIIEVNRILLASLADTTWRLFGSRAKGTATPYSDLEEKFAESNLTFKVDLVDWNRITPEFQEKIKQEWKALSNK